MVVDLVVYSVENLAALMAALLVNVKAATTVVDLAVNWVA